MQATLPRRSGRIIGSALLALLAHSFAAAQVNIERKERVQLKVTPLTATLAPGTRAEGLVLLIDPRRGAETEFVVVWPGAEDRCTVGLQASAWERPGTDDHAVELKAELTMPDGPRVRTSKRLTFDDRTTSLFELYRLGEASLTLVVEAEVTEETVVTRHPEVGPPVAFHLEIQRMQAGTPISLETNELNTFVGQTVSYSFSLGEEADSARITLKPLRLTAEVVEIEVQTSGTLPGEEELLVLGKTEHWIASRGAISTLTFESGDPPTGYRFLVTAHF